MKKLILFAAILFAGVSVVMAQQTEGLGKTDAVTLKVQLNAFQSLIVNSGQREVLINYENANDYWKGKSSESQKDHLEVVAAGGFVVNVKAETDLMSGENTILASSIKIQAEDGSKPLTDNVSYPEVTLSLSDQPLITSTAGGTGTGKTFNVSYSGAGEDEYIIKHINGETPTIYTTTVTYTIAAK